MKHLLRILPKNKKGFTLIEVLIASVILVIVMGSMTMVFIEANRAWIQTEAKLQVYQNARDALSRMTRELACAYQKSSSSLQKLLLVDDDDGNGNDKLELTASINVNPTGNEYDLSHLGYKLDASNSALKRYKHDYDDDNSDDNSANAAAWKDMAVHIISLNIRCYDGTTSTWETEWDPAGATPRNYLPQAVEITITAEDKQGRFTRIFVDTVYIPTS